jgi:hypothetical protein
MGVTAALLLVECVGGVPRGRDGAEWLIPGSQLVQIGA